MKTNRFIDNALEALRLTSIAAAQHHAFHNVPMVVWDEVNQRTQYINAREWLSEYNNIPNH